MQADLKRIPVWASTAATTWVCVALLSAPAASAAEAAKPAADPAVRADAMLSRYTPDRPGLAVLVAQHGQVIYERNLGAADLEHGAPVTAATRFHIASVSKQFTAFSILLLAHEGKVDLNADIHTYIPELADYGTKVTVSDLIHHTSGIRDQWELLIMSGMHIEDLITQKQIMAMAVAQKGLNFRPGTQVVYSNMAYSLLAEIVARVSGVSYRQFAHDHIFAPLGMNDTLVYDDAAEVMPNRAMTYRTDPKGVVHLARLNYSNYGATSVHTTTHDLLKWSQELLHPHVFPAAVVREAETPGHLSDGRPITYAFGMYAADYAGHHAIAHGGADAGFRTNIASFPAEDASIVVFSNGAADVGAVTTQMADVFLGHDPTAPQVVPADPARVGKLVGLYVDGWGPARELVAKDGRLYAKLYGQTLPATFLADGSFYVLSAANRYKTAANGDLLQVDSLSGLDVPFHRVVRATPTADELQAIAGAYRSDELDVTYRLSAKDGKIVVSSLRAEPMILTPAEKDQFDGEQMRVSVLRDASGKVSGIALSSGRVRDLKFVRQ